MMWPLARKREHTGLRGANYLAIIMAPNIPIPFHPHNLSNHRHCHNQLTAQMALTGTGPVIAVTPAPVVCPPACRHQMPLHRSSPRLPFGRPRTVCTTLTGVETTTKLFPDSRTESSSSNKSLPTRRWTLSAASQTSRPSRCLRMSVVSCPSLAISARVIG